jgi:hypothetical protein
MATNITQDTTPYIWSSANDDVVYTFTFKQKGIFGFADDGNGFVEIVLISPFDVTPVPGDYVFIDNPIYYGTYKIKSVVSSSNLILDTPYVAPTVVYTTIRHLRIPTFSLYKGTTGSEGYTNDLPYTKVSDIKPPVSYTGAGIPYISINIKGLVKSIFTNTFSVQSGEIDFNIFNAIRLFWDGVNTIYDSTIAYTFVLNSAITNDELKEKIITEGFYITPIDKPFIYTQGITFVNKFNQVTTVPYLYVYINGVLI